MSTPHTRKVIVEVDVKVTLDPTKFTDEFNAEFDHQITPYEGDLDEHAKHLAGLFAEGIIHGEPDEFVEGYGRLGDMGIKLERLGGYSELSD